MPIVPLLALVVASAGHPRVPLPLQPFTVELLDLKRGEWVFDDALGQRLSFPGPVGAFAFPGEAEGHMRVAYLCCDPEFPEDLEHAELRQAQAADGAFRIDEPYLAATVTLTTARAGVVRAELRDIRLGPATTGDHYVAGLDLRLGDETFPFWLAPDAAADGLSPRLLTDRVGHVFAAGERVEVTLAASWAGDPAVRRFALKATEYATGDVVWQGEVALRRDAGVSLHTFRVPLQRFGIFDVTATDGAGASAEVRICRVPEPAEVDPDESCIGINLFQQQIWWYAHQVPLMARAGVHWIRPWLAWENTWAVQEPEPGKWDTRALDAALRRMERYDQRYQIILFAPPAWAGGAGSWHVPPSDQMSSWSAYVERLVSQYRGRIRHYEVWNEPDLMWPDDTRLQGDHYVAMLKASYAAAKGADPECVVLGLSHAGVEEWLARVGGAGAGECMDIATVHSYAQPGALGPAVERRKGILERGGMGGTPVWVNELGTIAYDFSPGYSAKYGCSERAQAWAVPALYAEALAEDPRMKAFWFCTYDPRDAAHESQWTGDAGIGVLYLGFLPKLSYAALAATAREIDGRPCLGRVDVTRDIHQVSFEGPVVVVWHDQPKAATPIAATELGCLPRERLTVKDTFGNTIARGLAGDLTIDLSRGTLFIEGGRQMAAVARCESAFTVQPRELSVAAGATDSLRLAAPEGVPVEVTPTAGLPVSAAVEAGAIRLSVQAGSERASGAVAIRAHYAAGQLGLVSPHEAVRWVFVTTGEPNLIRDGAFVLGGVPEWTPERDSPYAWDADVGHSSAGSLRLDGPFDRRLVHWNITPRLGRPLRLRCWTRTEQLEGCLAVLSVAMFGGDGWLGTWGLATTNPASNEENGHPLIAKPAIIPTGSADWTLLDATLPADALTPETHNIAFFVDARHGMGRLWLDDIDLWQPE